MPGHRVLIAFGTAAVAATTLAATLLVPASAQTTPTLAPHRQPVTKPGLSAALALLRQQSVVYTQNGHYGPFGADPTRALVPDGAKVDWGGWRRAAKSRAKAAAEQRAAAQKTARLKAGLAAAPTPKYVNETEPAGIHGGNDTFGSAQPLAGFGTGTGSKPAYTVLGRLSPAPVPQLDEVAPSAEPNDTPETARAIGVSRTHAGVHTTGFIGDNKPDPESPRAPDVDIYKLTLRAGEQLYADIKRTNGNLLPATMLADSDGNTIQYGDNALGSSASLTATVRDAGTYYLYVIGVTIYDADATFTKGDYDATLYARAGDRDLYRVSLKAGDVLGASVSGQGNYVSVFDAKGVEVHGSGQDASAARRRTPCSPSPTRSTGLRDAASG
ncbi:MAG: hypothetical protein QOE51_3168 [Actinoplanes sp.]|jgi:hypothetical protein|nr:hypothetical protein [Actinoplanes sp.]